VGSQALGQTKRWGRGVGGGAHGGDRELGGGWGGGIGLGVGSSDGMGIIARAGVLP
jgi:hypothetical protein